MPCKIDNKKLSLESCNNAKGLLCKLQYSYKESSNFFFRENWPLVVKFIIYTPPSKFPSYGPASIPQSISVGISIHTLPQSTYLSTVPHSTSVDISIHTLPQSVYLSTVPHSTSVDISIHTISVVMTNILPMGASRGSYIPNFWLIYAIRCQIMLKKIRALRALSPSSYITFTIWHMLGPLPRM